MTDLVYKPIRATSHARRIIEYNIQAIETLMEFMLSSLEKEKQAFEKNHRADAEGTTGANDNGSEMDADDFYVLNTILPLQIVNSLIVVLYSCVETGMNSLCDAVRQDFNEKQEAITGVHTTLVDSYNDKPGKGIDRAKKYLKGIPGVDLNFDKQPWQEIKGLNKVRNTIVHNDSLIKVRNTIVHNDSRINEDILANSAIKKHIRKGLIEIIPKERADENGHVVESKPWKIVVKAEYVAYLIPQIRKFFDEITFGDI